MKAIWFGEDAGCFNAVYAEEIKKELEKVFDFNPKRLGKKDLPNEKLDDVEFMFSTWGMERFTDEEIERYFPSLKAIFYAAGTVQGFAKPFLDRGVRIFSAWKANAIPVAEFTVAQILLANKGFYQAERIIKESYDASHDFFEKFGGNYNTKVGILGYGAIGAEVVKLLKSFKVDVWLSSTSVTAERAKELGVTLKTMDEIFEGCDVISNHLANNPKTQKIIGKAQLDKMKSYSTFINTGRGAQVDEDALIEKLEKDVTITAVLDVTDPEPPVEGSKLYTLPNVVLTPHIAGSSGKEVQRMAEYMLEESKRFVNGEPLNYEVTKEMLEKMA